MRFSAECESGGYSSPEYYVGYSGVVVEEGCAYCFLRVWYFCAPWPGWGWHRSLPWVCRRRRVVGRRAVVADDPSR